MELSQNQTSQLMQRFPVFEPSYETISYKEVSSNYNICMAIPNGKKCFAWFTFHQDRDVCYILDINREKRITKATVVSTQFDESLSLGSLVYGTLIKDEKEHQWFVIEDVYFYKGISMKKCTGIEKLAFLVEFMERSKQEFRSLNDIVFVIPMIWKVDLTNKNEYPLSIPSSPQYQIHHIQYRSLYDTMPYLNINVNKKIGVSDSKKTVVPSSIPIYEPSKFRMDYSKPQYRVPAVFQVIADIQFDIYHLFAYEKNNKTICCGMAYIPNYKTSVFMNGLFRIIRENKNLDYIEESDDEEDFQNIDVDKYVNTGKVLLLECVFNHKFKKWTPVQLVDNRTKVVHVSKL